ncbi:hypothetical protein RAD16_24390 [Bradyrhizobium sp. 18BD]
MDEYYFVWIRGFDGRPKPQIWAADQFEGPDWRLSQVVARRVLDAAERGMGLDRLVKLFPAPSGQDEIN